MTRHSLSVINKLKFLRRSGLSIPRIVQETGLSKTTIWHHVHDIVLPSSIKKQIRSNQGGSKIRQEASFKKAKLHVKEFIPIAYKPRDLNCAVAMLYWAEGSKRELVFTNTDIDMVNLYIKFISRELGIDTNKIFLLIRISDPIVPNEAVEYWSLGTGMPVANIKINHNNLQNKTKTKHGICRVYTRKGAYSLKVIHCMIDAIKRGLMKV